MGSLEKNEQDSALLEVNLLKALNHPNIVSYKTSFISQGLLIIIMEYCEVGDLSFHIKRKLQKNEHFSETEIFNWFVQLCLALEYIHGRKVLHRDLKAQNIFLTGNNTVKLGDFGISKVLENTNGAAMTVVGTPYYMSPEVCQNQPYTFKSDVWALGCVLYELCTLKHAFSADNLLGLVYKIVQDKYEPIPDHYSQDLQNLINSMLNKNASERPSVAQILQTPIVRQKMQEFVKTGGSTIASKPVYVRNAPVIVPAHLEVSIKESESEFLTPQQRRMKRKEEEVKKKQEELAAHSKKAHENYQYAKQMQYNQLHSSVKGTAKFDQTVVHTKPQHYMEQTVIHQPPQIYPQNQHIQEDKLEYTEFSVNDRSFDFSESMGTQLTSLSLQESPSKFNNPSTYSNYDDRQVTGSGQYDLTMAKNEFDIEEDLDEDVEAKSDKKELQEVMKNYERILSGLIDDAEEMMQTTPKKNAQAQKQADTKNQIVGNNKHLIMNALGNDLFRKVYEFLKFNRRRGTDEALIHSEIKRMVQGDRQLMNHCFNLDGIVFMELLNE